MRLIRSRGKRGRIMAIKDKASLADMKSDAMEALGRITEFWGFSRIMGRLYGMLYLSPDPMTLDEMAEGLGVSKGNISINIRALLRWNMVRQVWVKGDRRDFYGAETDFWKIIKGVLKEREKKEFDQALSTFSVLREKAESAAKASSAPDPAFLAERFGRIEDFISTMDKIVGVLVTLEEIKHNYFPFTGGKSKK